MSISKKLYLSNMVAYLSFIIYSIIKFNKEVQGLYVVFAFFPYLTVLYTTFIFNFRFNKNLKRILGLSTIDFIVRLMALFVNFFLTTTKYGEGTFILVTLSIIVLFVFNLILEYHIQEKIVKLEKTDIQRELTVQQVIDNGSESEIFREVKSLKETVFLLIICLLILGFNRILGIRYLLFYILPFIIFSFLYIDGTYKNLKIYYENKDKVIKVFAYENIGIFLMLVFMLIYGFVKNGNGAIDFIIYSLISLLSLPRYYSRRTRLEEVYKKHMTL